MIGNDELNKDIKIQLSFQHNIFVKRMTFKESGSIYCGHHHFYDHITLVASGKVKVKFGAVPEGDLPEEEKEYEGSSMFVTRGYREHEITALEDNTIICCIHAIRSADGKVVDGDLFAPHPNPKSQLQRGFAYNMTPEQKLKSILRAEEEGTLQPGNADNLI
jgi:quercetin dioxygenase-like cupin family protein